MENRLGGRMLWGVMFCLHRPLHDEAAVRVAHKVMRAAGVEGIWWGGDLVDLATVSRWDDSDDYEHCLQDEFDDLARYFDWVHKRHPKLKRLVWQDGNHEDRVAHYLRRNAQKLTSLRCLKLESLARVDEFGVERVHGPKKLAGGRFMLKHGVKTGEYAGRAELAIEGRSGMCSHNHRLRVWSGSPRDRKPLFWYHGGTLMSLPPRYVDRDNWMSWQQGVNLLWVNGTDWSVEQVPVYRGKAVWRGMEFSA